MEVTKDVIVEASNLDMEGVKFFRDRKVLDKSIDTLQSQTRKEKGWLKSTTLTLSLNVFLDLGDFFCLF